MLSGVQTPLAETVTQLPLRLDRPAPQMIQSVESEPVQVLHSEEQLGIHGGQPKDESDSVGKTHAEQVPPLLNVPSGHEPAPPAGIHLIGSEVFCTNPDLH